MAGINYNRVFGGGLIAGVVFIIGDSLFPAIFSDMALQWLAALNLSAPTGGALAAAVLLALVLGFVAVWLYAAIRPRFGASPSTAVIAGLALWGLVIVMPSLSFAMLGAPVDAGFWVYLAWWLVFALVGTVGGAWAYQEEGDPEFGAEPSVAPAVNE